MSRQTDLQKLIEINNRRLQLLKEQQALHGLNTPPEIIMQIEEIESKLADLLATLASLDNSTAPPGPGRVLTEAEVTAQLARFETPTPPARQTQIGGVNISNISGGTITVGNISANVAAGGDIAAGGKSVTSTEAAPSDSPQAHLLAALAQWQQHIEAKIDALTALDDEEKADLKKNVERVTQEAAKGEQAEPGKIERWLNTLGAMAPDILEVTAATLQNPFAGVGLVLQKINDRVKLEREAKA